MLDTLRRIVQEVATATNLDEALTISVRRVKEAMVVDACYILSIPEIGSERHNIQFCGSIHAANRVYR